MTGLAPLIAAGTLCPRHPEREAVAACSRCGAFICALDLELVDEKVFCESCSTRDDVDWLGAWQRTKVGRRDGWAWVFGAFALLNGLALPWFLWLGQAEDLAGAWLPSLIALDGAVTCALFFLGWRPARTLIFAGPAVALLSAVFMQSAGLGIFAIACMLVNLSAYNDVRSKLFFRLEVPRSKVAAHYQRRVDNAVALLALRLAIWGVVVPVLGPVAVGLGGVGLLHVDSQATPPVGKRAHAVGAIVLGLGETAFLLFLFYNFFWAGRVH